MDDDPRPEVAMVALFAIAFGMTVLGMLYFAGIS